MMHARIKSRLVASALAAVLAPAAVVSGIAIPTAVEAATVKEAKCQAHAVLAHKEGDGTIPKELEFLKAQLLDDEFAAYDGYKLIDRKAAKVKLAKASELKFTTGNRLGLTLLDNDDSRLKLRAELRSRNSDKYLLSTEYSIQDGSVLMIRAGSYTDGDISGKLFFAIQCARSG